MTVETPLSNKLNSDRLREGSFNTRAEKYGKDQRATELPIVTIFNDLVSNVTSSSSGSIGAVGHGQLPGQSTYFEGTNIIVYIRGTEDEEGDWWNGQDWDTTKTHGKGGVLVNAHYDR
jgi:hypothetical protein